MELEYIKETSSWESGGGITLDIVELKDGHIGNNFFGKANHVVQIKPPFTLRGIRHGRPSYSG
jgi:hypothetical protein